MSSEAKSVVADAVEGPAVESQRVPPHPTPVGCLILACGNTLRGDDGVGPWLAAWAEERFAAEPAVRVLSRQQWTPDLAEDVAQAESVVFLDCSVESSPGEVRFRTVGPAAAGPGLASHHTGAAELLTLSRELYNTLPLNAFLLTIGIGSTELGEEFSSPVKAALSEACSLLTKTLSQLGVR
jgi:hydrogenase maturation protease